MLHGINFERNIVVLKIVPRNITFKVATDDGTSPCNPSSKKNLVACTKIWSLCLVVNGLRGRAVIQSFPLPNSASFLGQDQHLLIVSPYNINIIVDKHTNDVRE